MCRRRWVLFFYIIMVISCGVMSRVIFGSIFWLVCFSVFVAWSCCVVFLVFVSRFCVIWLKG